MEDLTFEAGLSLSLQGSFLHELLLHVPDDDENLIAHYSYRSSMI